MLDKLKFWKREKEESEIDEQIRERLEHLDWMDDVETDKSRIDNVKELVDIKTQLEGRKEQINPNTVLAGVFSVGSVVAIMIYENRHVFTTAAKNFIPKLRI